MADRFVPPNRKPISSNGIPIEVGQIVIYNAGTLEKCVVRKVTRHRIHLEVVESSTDYYNHRSYELGHKYSAKTPSQIWVLDETMQEVLERWFVYEQEDDKENREAGEENQGTRKRTSSFR